MRTLNLENNAKLQCAKMCSCAKQHTATTFTALIFFSGEILLCKKMRLKNRSQVLSWPYIARFVGCLDILRVIMLRKS